MIFNRKKFTITIGNKGAIIALHDRKKIENKFFIESLSRKEEEKILKTLTANKMAPVYIFLDNSEQNYTNKNYPGTNIIDLNKIIKRYEAKEFKKPTKENEAELIFNRIINKNKINHNWECMYISSIYFKEMQKWVNFLLKKAPNYLDGIYMLPVEIYSLVKNVKIGKEPSKNSIKLVITQNKVSGIRQTILMGKKIIFTRIAQYDFNSDNFIVDFEQDIFRTSEYLKRILPNLSIKNIAIINILPSTILEKVKNIKNSEITFNNYTPYDFAILNKCNNLIPKNSQYCDLLIANIFAYSRKILKFNNEKIKKLFYFNAACKAINSISITFLAIMLIYLSRIQIEQVANSLYFKKLTKDGKKIERELNVINRKAQEKYQENDYAIYNDIDSIIEFGKFNEVMTKNYSEPINIIKNIEFINKEIILINDIIFKNDSNIENNKKSQFQLSINTTITNANGDVDSLFKTYDRTIEEFKDNLENYTITEEGLPDNLDYTKEYYEVPVKITIKEK